MWSDNATSQFKNQFIMNGLKSLESRHNKKIRWNFYAPMHGKSIIDGIGGSVKRFVKGRILAQDLLVNSAEDFVRVASAMNTKVILMTADDIESRNIEIDLNSIIKESKKIAGISKNQSFSVEDVNVRGKIVQKVVGCKFST
jgi:hypothetical protein